MPPFEAISVLHIIGHISLRTRFGEGLWGGGGQTLHLVFLGLHYWTSVLVLTLALTAFDLMMQAALGRGQR